MTTTQRGNRETTKLFVFVRLTIEFFFEFHTGFSSNHLVEIQIRASNRSTFKVQLYICLCYKIFIRVFVCNNLMDEIRVGSVYRIAQDRNHFNIGNVFLYEEGDVHFRFIEIPWGFLHNEFKISS